MRISTHRTHVDDRYRHFDTQNSYLIGAANQKDKGQEEAERRQISLFPLLIPHTFGDYILTFKFSAVSILGILNHVSSNYLVRVVAFKEKFPTYTLSKGKMRSKKKRIRKIQRVTIKRSDLKYLGMSYNIFGSFSNLNWKIKSGTATGIHNDILQRGKETMISCRQSGTYKV